MILKMYTRHACMSLFILDNDKFFGFHEKNLMWEPIRGMGVSFPERAWQIPQTARQTQIIVKQTCNTNPTIKIHETK